MSRAMFQAAKWIAEVGRSKANDLAGENLPHVLSTDSDEYTENVVKGLKIDTALTPKAPIFNVVSNFESILLATGCCDLVSDR